MEFENLLNEEKGKSPSQENTAHFQTMKREVESLEDFEEITKDEPSLKDLTAQFLQFETTGKPEKLSQDELNFQRDQFHLKREDKDESPIDFSHEGLGRMPKDYDSQMESFKEPNVWETPGVDFNNASNDLLSFEDSYSQAKSENIKKQSTEKPIINLLDENKLSDVISNDEISTGSDDLSFLPERGESAPVMHSDFEKNFPNKPELKSKESFNLQPLLNSQPGLKTEKELDSWQGDGLHVKDNFEAEASDNDEIAPEPIPKDYPEIGVLEGKEFLAAIGLDLKNVANQIVDEVQEKVRSKLSQNGPQDPTSTTCDSALTLIINPYTWFHPHLLNPRVESLIYWRDPKKSGIVFGSVLVVLLSLTTFSLISVLAHTSLLVLVAALGFRIYKSVLQAVQKTSEGHPFKTYLDAVVNHPIITTVFFTIEEYLDVDLTLNPEKAREVSDVVISQMNKALIKCRSLFLVEDVIDSVKFAVLLYCLTYVGAWFNGLSLLIICFVGLFTLPKVYENNKTQIDANIDIVKSKINDVSDKIRAVIPLGKKPEEVKDKGE